MSDLRERVVGLVRDLGYVRRDEPFRLASGQLSQDYVDAKRAVANGRNLRLVAQAMAAEVTDEYDAVGGLTMGADPFAHAVAVVVGCDWFSVRKEPKGRGTDQWIEGAQIGPGSRVLLVDDVVTTGGSIFRAYDRTVAAGARVVAAITLVDRGDVARAGFARRGVAYSSLVGYTDLGIAPVQPAPTG